MRDQLCSLGVSGATLLLDAYKTGADAAWAAFALEAGRIPCADGSWQPITDAVNEMRGLLPRLDNETEARWGHVAGATAVGRLGVMGA